MKYVLAVVACLACSVLFAQCAVREEDRDKDGTIDHVVIENEVYEIVFRPANGGRAVAVRSKPWGKSVCGSHWFGDEVVELATDFTRYACVHPYQYKILENKPDLAKLQIFGNLPEFAPQPAYKEVSISRTYTLTRGSGLITVQFEAKNGSKEQLPLTIQVQHWAWIEGEGSYYFVPDEMGVLVGFDDVLRHASGPVGSQQPAAPWTGFSSTPSKLGFAFQMEWKYLDAIEDWLSGRESAAVQWPFRRQILKPGETFATSYTIFPISGMESLDAVANGLALGVTVGKDVALGRSVAEKEVQLNATLPVKLYLASAAKRSVSVEFATRIPPEENPVPIETKPVEVPANGAAVTLDFSYTPKQPGLHILTFTAKEGDRVVVTAERPLTIGDSPYVYFMPKPKEPQIGDQLLGTLIIDPPIQDWYSEVDLSWTTPHIPWGRPYHRGTAGVLFVSRNENSVAHWREIWERGDLAIDLSVLAFREAVKYPYTMPTQRQLLKKLATPAFDVMFFAGLDWQRGFIKPVSQRIFSLVQQGKGAVILGNPDGPDETYGDLKKFLTDAKKVDEAEIASAYPFRHAKVWLYEKGQGRVVVIEGAPGYYESVNASLGEWLPDGNRWLRGWEYGYSLFLRAIYWAAHLESPVLVEKIEGAPEAITLHLDNRSQESVRAIADVTVRNHLYEPEGTAKGAFAIRPGKNVFPLALTGSLSDKKHVADVILRDPDGRSICWGSATFVVERPATVEVKLDRETAGYREHDPVSAIVTLKRISPRSVPVQIDLRATDAYGRVAWKGYRELTLVNPEATFTVPIELRRADVLHDLDVTVREYDKVLSRARATFYVFPERMPLYDDFYVACWGALEPDPIKYQSSAQKLREAGIDYTYSYGAGGPSRDLAYRTHGFLLGPPSFCSLANGYSGKRDCDRQNLTMEPPLVPREDELKKFREATAKMAKDYSEIGGADYHHMDDERSLSGDYDMSDYSLAAFRKWLQGQYKSLEALNAEWDANFKTWDEVKPARREDLKAAAAGGAMVNLAPWLDFRLFTGWVIDEYYIKVPAEAAKQGNPRAVVGMHGVYQTSTDIPHDFSQFAKYTPVTGRYNGMEEEWYLSLSPGCIHGQYGGYGVEQATPGHRFHPWRSLLHGGHWCFYYIMWNAGTHGQGILSPDQSVHGGYKDLAKDEFSDLKGGIGKLFIETNFTHDGIAFPYSQSSLIGRAMDGGSHAGNLYTYKTLVQDLGFQHWTLSYEHISAGELIKQDFKLLILPCTTFVSKGEVEAIRKFVKRGGVLVADYRTAIRDEHGKAYPAAPLDDVFGIDRKGAKFEFTKSLLTFDDAAPESLRGRKLDMTLAEPGLELAGGKALARFADGTPAVILNKFGSGKALYFNVDFSGYAGSKGAGVRGEVIIEQKGAQDYLEITQAVFGEAIRLAGLERRFTILKDGKPFNNGETFYYRRPGEEALYIATMFNVAQSTPVELRYGKRAHFYDVRDHRYIGFTDSFTDTFEPGRVKVYAALPYRVTGIVGRFSDGGPTAAAGSGQNVTVPGYRPGEDVVFSAELQAAGGKPGLHIFRMTVFAPDGAEVRAYRKNLVAEGGAIHHTIPLAWNEKPGTWTIRLTDVASSAAAALSFVVAD